jgi:hypothetical protein
MNTWTMGRWSWWMAVPALVLVRVLWCELHGPAMGESAATLDVSVPWALQASLGWVAAAVLLARCGPRLLGSEFGLRHPSWTRALIGAAMAALTVTAETCLLLGDSPLAPWLYERVPLHLTFAALLLGGYLVARRKTGVALEPTPSLLEVMTGTGSTQVRLDEIECLEADRNYINVHTPRRSYLLRRTLASLEQSLDAAHFQRVHRSIIVNRARIRERRPGGVLVLDSGRQVRVSRAYADRLQ